jgi:hypothetical protein
MKEQITSEVLAIDPELEERQHRIIELRNVTPKDGKARYATAQAEIEEITAQDKWEEPAAIAVQNAAGHDICVDGQKIPKGGTASIYPWQFRGLARFLKPVHGMNPAAQTQPTNPTPINE